MRDHLTPPHLRQRRRPALRVLVVDLALGLIAALGIAPLGIWGATLPALALLLWRLARAPRACAAFWQALAAGLGWFSLSMFWIVEPFLVRPEIHGWMAPFALLLMATGGALFWALPVTLAHRIGAGWHARLAGIAAVLVLSDWLRGWLLTGLPWALIGHIWIGTPVDQMAAYVGAPGLSAITLGLVALPALLWRPGPVGGLRGAALAALALGAVWAGGLARLAAPLPPDHDVTLRLVQPNAAQQLKWHPDWATEFYRRLLDLSSQPGPRDLVIWPETAVNFLLNDAGPVLPQMAGAAGAPLITGIQRAEGRRYFNSLAVLSPDAQLIGRYDKFHLVPFGEYIPMGDLLARLGITGAFAAQQGGGYTAGPGPQLLTLPDPLPATQPLICYEAIFAQHLRALPARPGWLLQITNDGWFGKINGPYQHLAQTQLRAVQSGLPLIRVANTGVSAVIDARGRIRGQIGLGQVGYLDARLPGALPPTPWMRLGDWPVIALAAALLALSARRQRRHETR